jgi:putative ABC transport system permease protein
MRKWFSRLAAIGERKRIDEDLHEEINTHLQMEIDANLERGMPLEEATRSARRNTGNLTLIRESAREAWGFTFLESVFQDIRFAARLLRHNPGFTAAAVLTLALGIGANTAIFTVIRTILLAPLPYPQADRIVRLQSVFDDLKPQPYLSILKFVKLRDHYETFEDATLYWAYGGRANLTSGDRPEQVGSLHVSANYFRLFGATPALGRAFTSDEDRPGGPLVVVMSDGLWRRRFGADPQIVGKTIGIGGAPYQVTGILKPGFYWEGDVDLWLPLQADLASTGVSHEYYAAARLKPAVSLTQGNVVMKAVFEAFHRQFQGNMAFAGQGLAAESVQTVATKEIRPTLNLLFGAGLLVLLIACANLANLLLARGLARNHEISIRAALAAGRGRIIRQLFTESVLLSAGGSLLGLVLGWVGLRALLSVSLATLPRLGERGANLVMDREVIAFALGLGILTSVFYGLIPALQAVRTDTGNSLQNGGTRTATGNHQRRMRSLLVVTEIAVAIVLLIGAALLIRTYQALRSVQPGFDGSNVIALDMSVDGPRFQKAADMARLAHDGTERLEAISGVKAAATTWTLPLEPPNDPQFFTIEGRPLAGKTYHGIGDWRIVTPHYFDVFRIPILRGRFFTDHDRSLGVPVVVINNQMAKALWPNSNPLGQRIWLNKGLGAGFEEAAPRVIVGVAGDVKDSGLSAATGMLIYVPVAQVQDAVLPFYSRAFRLMWAIRTGTEPIALSESIKHILAEVSGGLPVGHVRSMDEVRAESTARIDFTTSLFTIFAVLAVSLAAIGIYGVIAYTVEQRRREIGIRVAVGASPRNVIEMILRESGRLTLAGIAIGVACGLALTKFLASFLFGVTPRDPVAFAATAFLLGAIALFAASIPARRATRVDPVVALRGE